MNNRRRHGAALSCGAPVRAGVVLMASLALLGCSPAGEQGTRPGLTAADAIRVSGEIESAQAAIFGPPVVPGTWQFTIAYMAPEGRKVKAGTPILRFDTQDLETRLRDKRNALNEKQKQLEKQKILAREAIADMKMKQEEARAALDKAKLKADIPAELLASRDYRENKLLLQQARLTLRQAADQLSRERHLQDTEIAILKREIEVLQGEVSQYQASVDSMTIRANSDGVVIHTVDHHNNKYEVGDNVWMGHRVLELPDLNKLQVHLEIPERESARIAAGQAVKFVLDAAPDRQFYGVIVKLASVIHTKSTQQPARVFDASVSLKNPDPAIMRPGMSVTAEIEVGRPGVKNR